MLLWLIIGLIIGAGILALVPWLRNRGIKVTWYEWLIVAIGLLLLMFAIDSFVGSRVELEPSAAWMFGLMFGLPALILVAITWQLVRRRKRAAS